MPQQVFDLMFDLPELRLPNKKSVEAHGRHNLPVSPQLRVEGLGSRVEGLGVRV